MSSLKTSSLLHLKQWQKTVPSFLATAVVSMIIATSIVFCLIFEQFLAKFLTMSTTSITSKLRQHVEVTLSLHQV